MATSLHNLATQCVDGIKPTLRGPERVEKGLAIVTTLVPIIGYDLAAEIAKKAQSQEAAKAAVEVFAKNEQKETQLCITALKKGLTPVREKIGNLNTILM